MNIFLMTVLNWVFCSVRIIHWQNQTPKKPQTNKQKTTPNNKSASKFRQLGMNSVFGLLISGIFQFP